MQQRSYKGVRFSHRPCLAVLSLRCGLHQHRRDHAHHLWGGNGVLCDHLWVLEVSSLKGAEEKKGLEQVKNFI